MVPFPDDVRKALVAGRTLTWGIEPGGDRPAVEAEFTLVREAVVRPGLDVLTANAHLRKQQPHVLATRVARALRRAGLASEALIHAAHAIAQAPEYVPAKREIVRLRRLLFGKRERDWGAHELIQALRSPKGPWKLLGLPKPAAN